MRTRTVGSPVAVAGGRHRPGTDGDLDPILGLESVVEGVGRIGGDARHGQRGHRPEHRVGRRRLHPERVGDEVTTGDRQRMVGGEHGRPAAAIGCGDVAHPVDRGGERQEPGRVGRPDPVELVAEARSVAEHGVGPVRHDQRVDPLAAVLADPQHGRALRPAQPLVPVGRPVGRAQRVDVDRDHAGCVGRVDERVDASRVQLRDELADREDDPGRAGHVADEHEPRAWGHGARGSRPAPRRGRRSGRGSARRRPSRRPARPRSASR